MKEHGIFNDQKLGTLHQYLYASYMYMSCSCQSCPLFVRYSMRYSLVAVIHLFIICAYSFFENVLVRKGRTLLSICLKSSAR